MQKTTMVVLFCGFVALVWGSPLCADMGTSQQPSKEFQGAGTNPTNSKQISGGLFGKSQAGIPASMIPGAVFEAHQNPATGNVPITYRLEKPGQVVFTVSDAEGKTVREMVYQDQFAGLYRAVWDGQGADSKFVIGKVALKPVPNGVYSLKMTSPDGVKTTQFTYQR